MGYEDGSVSYNSVHNSLWLNSVSTAGAAGIYLHYDQFLSPMN